MFNIDLFETHKEEMGIVELFKEYFGSARMALLPRPRMDNKAGQDATHQRPLLTQGQGAGFYSLYLLNSNINAVSADFANGSLSRSISQRSASHFGSERQLKFLTNRYSRTPWSTYDGNYSRLLQNFHY